MARVLPRRLPPVLPTTYSSCFLDKIKGYALHNHSGFPSHPCRNWKVFAPAASRRTCFHVSESISRLSLSWPLPVTGLWVLYTHNSHDRSQSNPQAPELWLLKHSSIQQLWSISLSFPRLSSTWGYVSYVLLSSSASPNSSRLAWLSRILITVISVRINRNCGNYY